MTTPNASVPERLLELVGEVYGLTELDEFRSGLLPALKRAVPSEWTSYNEVHAKPEDVFVVMDPVAPPEQIARYAQFAHDHPLVEHIQRTGDGRPYKISDFVTQDEFHASAIYQGFYREMGVEYQMAFTLPSRRPLVIGIALSREHRDYDEGERELLQLARPHLIQAYRAAALSTARAAALEALEAGLDVAGQMVIVLGSDGAIEFMTPAAADLLADRHPGWRRAHRVLPEPIDAWVAAQRSNGTGPTARPLVIGEGTGRMLVRRLPGSRKGAPEVLLLDARRDPLPVGELQALGLTAREAETLRWLALGHGTAHTAGLLNISPRTVHKHLERAYRKLGVTDRSQAAATVWAAVGVETALDQ